MNDNFLAALSKPNSPSPSYIHTFTRTSQPVFLFLILFKLSTATSVFLYSPSSQIGSYLHKKEICISLVHN